MDQDGIRFLFFSGAKNDSKKNSKVRNERSFFPEKKYIGLPNIFRIKSIKFGGFYIRLTKSNKKSSYHQMWYGGNNGRL